MRRKTFALLSLLVLSLVGCGEHPTADATPERGVPGALNRGINGLGGGYVVGGSEPQGAEATTYGTSGSEVGGDTTTVGRGINGLGGG